MKFSRQENLQILSNALQCPLVITIADIFKVHFVLTQHLQRNNLVTDMLSKDIVERIQKEAENKRN